MSFCVAILPSLKPLCMEMASTKMVYATLRNTTNCTGASQQHLFSNLRGTHFQTEIKKVPLQNEARNEYLFDLKTRRQMFIYIRDIVHKLKR